jgi:hypothetical protein
MEKNNFSGPPKNGLHVLLWEKHIDHPFVGYWSDGKWWVSLGHVADSGGWDCGGVVGNIDQESIDGWAYIPAKLCNHKWMTTQQGVSYVDCKCEYCGATKRETWD